MKTNLFYISVVAEQSNCLCLAGWYASLILF
jgi:hypothetical protein